MTAKHWIADCRVDAGAAAYNGGVGESLYVIYHFLRTAGWSSVWECDGYNNHLPDGSMEDAGVSNWTPTGTGAVSKITSDKHMGVRCAEVSIAATDDTVQSAALTDVIASTVYRVSLWYKAETVSDDFDVEVDNGDASWVSIGTVTGVAASGWRRFEGTFTSHTSGDAYIRFRQLSTSGTDFYIDSAIIYESWFEYNGVTAEDLSGSPDGEILNGNEFSSASHSFASDTGKYVCIWDPQTPEASHKGNSGVYKITGVNGDDAQFDLRAGGSPALFAATGLRWRLLDMSVAPQCAGSGASISERLSGCMLESPFSEPWRIAFKLNYRSSGNPTWINTWSSPVDAAYDVDTGYFLSNVFGTHNKFPIYLPGEITATCFVIGGASSGRTSTYLRVYLMTDTDNSFLFILLRPGDGTFPNLEGATLAGFTEADTYHTLQQSYIHFGTTSYYALTPAISFLDLLASTFYNGLQCTDFGWMEEESSIMSLGIGISTLGEKNMSNCRANPFDGKHWLRTPKLGRDFYGTKTGDPTEKSLNMGMWETTPTIIIYSTIDDDKYLHIREGFCIEWNEREALT
ncbi:MAG: carbohydrate binding domain-containing protein [Candidatus Hodarchaeales archaeon]|jgi:hypothetical protein